MIILPKLPEKSTPTFRPRSLRIYAPLKSTLFACKLNKTRCQLSMPYKPSIPHISSELRQGAESASILYRVFRSTRPSHHIREGLVPPHASQLRISPLRLGGGPILLCVLWLWTLTHYSGGFQSYHVSSLFKTCGQTVLSWPTIQAGLGLQYPHYSATLRGWLLTGVADRSYNRQDKGYTVDHTTRDGVASWHHHHTTPTFNALDTFISSIPGPPIEPWDTM
jgi:hypothetical protein